MSESKKVAAEKAKQDICEMLGIKESQITAWDMFSPSLKLVLLRFTGLPESIIKFSWANLSDTQRTQIKAAALANRTIFDTLFKELSA